MKKKALYIIQGYEKELDDQRLAYVTTFEVKANTEEEALKIVKNYTTIPKKYYRVERVLEVYK